MHVLIADSLSSVCVEGLQAAGCTIHMDPSLSGDTLAEALEAQSPDVLVVRSTKVDAAAFAAAPGLMLVVRAGAGTNTIDVRTASSRGVYVSNCPGKNAVAVAELAWGLILAADREIPNTVRDLRAGQWNKKRYEGGYGLAGRTLGIVGLGQIGAEMVPRALAFGMDVVAWSHGMTEAQAKALRVRRVETIEELAAASDVVTVHVALVPATRGLIGADFFAQLRPGAIFVNTSRGEVVDEGALLTAVEERGLRCGLDVWCDEPAKSPAPFDRALARHERVFGTHHIGASTAQAQEAVADEVVRIVASFKRTGVVPNCVNLCETSVATHVLIVRHRDEVGVLASVLDAIQAAGINVQEMENVIFEGSEAAVAKIRIEAPPDAAALARINARPEVISARVVAL